MNPFEAMLEQTRPLSRLGDVRFEYDGAVWVGQATRPSRGWGPVAALGVALITAIGAIAVLGFAPPSQSHWSAWLAGAAAIAFVAAGVLEQRERRQRRFVLIFPSETLRLDFSTPLAGRPRSLHVPFDQVLDVQPFEQGDGRGGLYVEFQDSGGQRYREVLVAHISAEQEDARERLRRFLSNAFGLRGPQAKSDGAWEIDRFTSSGER